MSRRLVFDIETNGLLKETTLIHSLVLIDIDTGECFSCANKEGFEPIAFGLQLLSDASCIVGHNVICFDLPIIKRLYPAWGTQADIIDTLVCSRLIWADLKNLDFDSNRRVKHGLPPKLFGSHSLKAWGYRLRDNKGSYNETTDWQEWSIEMQEYCEQDVKLTLKFFKLIDSKRYSQIALEIEHAFQTLIFQQEEHGIFFDTAKAARLLVTLNERKATLSTQLQEAFPPKNEGDWFIPKVNNKTRGYVKGVAVWRDKIVEFNPSSRDHIASRLKDKYQWKPVAFTEDGRAKLDESVLSQLPYPEASLLTEYFLIEKRLGQLSDGAQAWLKLEEDGKIHGRVTTNGAVTGRCTHHHPNMAQVPAVGVPYGEDCRALFYAPAGFKMLGCDAAGLELRCLSHYLTKYDGGIYRDEVLHGDIHTTNQKAAGLATRAEAKRFIYAFLYGAGDFLIGDLLTPEGSEEQKKKKGSKVKREFLRKTPALASLIEDVQSVAKTKGFLRGLDGRILKVRSQHSALNLLLQSAGAVVMKKATCILWEDVRAGGYKYGEDVAQVLHIHDEYQLFVREGLEESIGAIAVNAIKKAGECFNFRCPLDGEYKVGQNWAETH